MAIIALEGLTFFAYHGVYGPEKVKGNQFVVDLYLTSNIKEAAKSDHVKKTVDYAEVYSLIKVIMGDRVDLLETLVDRINSQILANFSLVSKVKVRVSKLNPALGGICARSYVEAKKSR